MKRSARREILREHCVEIQEYRHRAGAAWGQESEPPAIVLSFRAVCTDALDR